MDPLGSMAGGWPQLTVRVQLGHVSGVSYSPRSGMHSTFIFLLGLVQTAFIQFIFSLVSKGMEG